MIVTKPLSKILFILSTDQCNYTLRFFFLPPNLLLIQFLVHFFFRCKYLIMLYNLHNSCRNGIECLI